MPRSDERASNEGRTPEGEAGGASRGQESESGTDGGGERREPESGADADTGADADPEAVLSEALGTVAHGAVVSVPSLLCQRVLAVAFTAVLTNGFAAAAYGVFALAKRVARLLRRLPYGLQSGMNRYLPVVETPAERDHLITVTAGLFFGVAVLFGGGLYLLAPRITAVTGKPAGFTTLLRVFGVGLPVVVGMQNVAGVFRSLERVGALNLVLRIGFPLASLVAAVVGTAVFGSTLAVAAAFVVGSGVVGLLGAVHLARLGVRPRLRAPEDGADAHGARAYLRYVTPVFFARLFTVTQRLGFYPVMALLLPGRASGVFTVGLVVGELVKLPLSGVNQFMSPVAAGLHGRGNRAALRRLYAVTSRLILFGVVFLGAVAVVYRREVMALFGPAYVADAWVVPAFVVAHLVGCAVGSVGILLVMTDHQHASLWLNGAVVAVTYAVTVPLTLAYGLPGVVAGFVVSLTINNVAEVLVLRRLAGLWPFTRAHLKPFVAAVPLVAVLAAVGAVTAGPATLAVGGLAGGVVYAAAVRAMGVDPVVRELVDTLVERYRAALPAVG